MLEREVVFRSDFLITIYEHISKEYADIVEVGKPSIQNGLLVKLRKDEGIVGLFCQILK